MYSEEQYLEDAEDMLRQPIINDQTRERRKKAFQSLAKSYISEEQIKNKGEFLGHFEESGFWGMGNNSFTFDQYTRIVGAGQKIYRRYLAAIPHEVQSENSVMCKELPRLEFEISCLEVLFVLCP